jgi:hypothetical protein
MAKPIVPPQALPRLPQGIAFDRASLGPGVATFAREYLVQKGELTNKCGPLARFSQNNAVRKLAKIATPELDRLIELQGPNLRTELATQAIDKAKFKMEAAKTSRRSWWVSGGFFLGALLGFAAFNYGVGLGFKHFLSPALAEGIQAAWNPIVYTVGGALVGAATGLFIDKLSSPTRAFINRFGFKGAPVQPGDISPLTREFIFTNQVEGIVDGRFNGGRWSLTTYEILNNPAFANAGRELRAARTATDPKVKQECIELAAMFVAGRLINNELYWFAFDPSNVDMFENLRLTLGVNFAKSSPDDLAAFRKAVIEEVRKKRKTVDTRTPTEDAIKSYYDPFLDRILTPAKAPAQPLTLAPVVQLATPVAHAG